MTDTQRASDQTEFTSSHHHDDKNLKRAQLVGDLQKGGR